MKLFFDEDTGRGVPEALRAIGIRCEYVSQNVQVGGVAKGTADEDWIPRAGQRRLLVFSCNQEILRAEAQRELWINANVGGVFLTSGQEKKRDLLLLILRRYEWLEAIDETPRPFAYKVDIRGKARREF